LSQEKLIAWRKWYGLPNQHNGAMPKDSWLFAKEEAGNHLFFLFEPWWWLSARAYVMIDKDVAHASPSTV